MIIFESNVLELTAGLETKLFVKPDTGLIVTIDRCDDFFQPSFRCCVQQRCHQRPADLLAQIVWQHINAVFRTGPIAFIGSEIRQAAVADDQTRNFGNKNRPFRCLVTLVELFDPAGSGNFVAPAGGRMFNIVAQDTSNRRIVSRLGWPDDRTLHQETIPGIWLTADKIARSDDRLTLDEMPAPM